MTTIQRIKKVLGGLIMAITALVLLLIKSEYGYIGIMIILSCWLTIYGLKDIIYYFTMARFMTGGRMLLYKGILFFDFGVVTASLSSFPKIYVILYLVGIYGFLGLVRILRALEAKKYGAKSWRLKFSHGLVNIAMAFLCVLYIKDLEVAIAVYAVGILYSGVVAILSAFRRTTFIYIQ